MEKSTSVRGNTLLYKLWKNESLFSNYMYIKAKRYLKNNIFILY